MKKEIVEVKKEKVIKDVPIDLIKEHPDRYIEVNILKENRIIDTFYVYANEYKFKYNNFTYIVKSKSILLLPKHDYFIPTIYYKENIKNPVSFENKNKGVPSRILTLLYDLRLYKMLIQLEQKNINIILIALCVVSLCAFGMLTYALYNTGIFGV